MMRLRTSTKIHERYRNELTGATP